MAMLLCVVAFVGLSSCSKDNEDQIIGKWKVVQHSYNDNGNGMEVDSRMGDIWEFKSGGIVILDGEQTSYSISGDDITIMGGMLFGSITTLTNSKLILDLKFAMTYGDNPYPTEHIEFSKM